MGAACSSNEPADAQSRAIDRQLDRERLAEEKKLLLLGAGECGKSTILKQVRIHHDTNWSTDLSKEREKARIYANIIDGTVDLCRGVEKLDMVLDRDVEEHADRVKGLQKDLKERKLDLDKFSAELVVSLKVLWDDATIKRVYELRNQLQVADSISYFLDSIDRIAADGYKPTNDDYLQLRVRTTGVVEHRFVIKDEKFSFVDVGGQRSERRKWVHHFDSATSVLFISAINEFDQVMNEDATENRLRDSMKTYHDMVNSVHFATTPFILFLNKVDLFEEKIGKHNKSITVLFRDYKGPNTVEDSLVFIENKFLAISEGVKVPYLHRTCATDSDQVKKVIASVVDAIITKNLAKMGIV